MLRSLTFFINLILVGQIPEAVCPLFIGAKLIALEKMGGWSQTQCCGCMLRRLVAKAEAVHVKGAMHSLLVPCQLGYRIPQGVEAARMYLENLPSDHVLLKLDFSNAFNCVR